MDYNHTILDSGTRREFDSGAVRDIQVGKGRCDLMPLHQLADFTGSTFIEYVSFYYEDFKDPKLLVYALLSLCEEIGISKYEYSLLLSKHFEDGANKYGENNWRKGIPIKSYIDSAIRHYLKWKDGQDDEPHEIAAGWNLLCCMWEDDNNSSPATLEYLKSNIIKNIESETSINKLFRIYDVFDVDIKETDEDFSL